jgi:hypothetical protein
MEFNFPLIPEGERGYKKDIISISGVKYSTINSLTGAETK